MKVILQLECSVNLYLLKYASLSEIGIDIVLTVSLLKASVSVIILRISDAIFFLLNAYLACFLRSSEYRYPFMYLVPTPFISYP